jgi:hypothetical protein
LQKKKEKNALDRINAQKKCIGRIQKTKKKENKNKTKQNTTNSKKKGMFFEFFRILYLSQFSFIYFCPNYLL